MKFIIDKEVNLDQSDLLHMSSYSSALKDIILDAPKDAAFTIGLFGEWGSGKSSIIKTVSDSITITSKGSIKFIGYDAWKYSEDSFRRMFLLQVQQDLNLEKSEKFDAFYKNRSSDVKIDQKVNYRYMAATLGIFLLGLILVLFIDDTKNDLKLTITLIVSFSAFLVNIIGRAFGDYKVSVQEPMIFAPEQFEDCFNEMIDLALKKDSKLTTVLKWVKIKSATPTLERIVIVVDNIDRCPKELAYELITNIKNFLGNKKSILFMIPVDDEALKRHIQKDSSSTEKESEEFLRKFFNVTLRIKPFKRFDLYDFTNRINYDNKLDFSPTTIDIISKEYATNPRRIIQFFNNLIAEVEIFKLRHNGEFAKTNESLICKMLILREEWPEYYKTISQNSSLIDKPDEKVREMINSKKDLAAFLGVTDSISRNEDFELIEKVLSITDRSSSVPIEVVETIQKKDTEKLIEIVEDGRVLKKELIDFLIEKLNTGIKRGTFQTDVNNTFEIICIINEKLLLEQDENTRVYNETKHHLIFFIPYVNDFDILCKYANHLSIRHLKYLRNWIVDYFISALTNQQRDEQFYQTGSRLFRAFLLNAETQEIQKYKGSFLIDYTHTKSKLMDFSLSGEKLQQLKSADLIKYIITNIIDFNTSDLNFSELHYLASYVQFDQDDIDIIINRINDLYTSLSGKPKAEVLHYLSNLNSILGNQEIILDETRSNTLTTFYNLVVGKIALAAGNYKLIDQIEGEEEIGIVINFLLNVYKITNGRIEITSQLQNLINRDEKSYLIWIMALSDLSPDKRYKLNSFNELILNNKNYTLEYNKLLMHFLILKENDEYIISDEALDEKISEILLLSVHSDDKNLQSFLETLSTSERLKPIITVKISTLNKEQIISLNKNLQSLAFDEVAEGDRIFEFEDNIDFLMAMASSGNAKHTSRVVKLIVNKLTREETVLEGIMVLSAIRHLDTTDRKMIGSVIEDINGEEKRKTAIDTLNSIEL